MTVTLTSPALGLDVGATYTGPEEAWLLANGYARQNSYTGPGVSNTGLASSSVGNDLTLAPNREPEPKRNSDGTVDPGPLDPAMTFSTADDDPNDPDADYDFDAGGVNNDVATISSVTPSTGLATVGGTVLTLKGKNFEGTTGATVGGTAATAVTVVDDETLHITTPAKSAGTYAVAVTNASGTATKSNAVTFA